MGCGRLGKMKILNLWSISWKSSSNRSPSWYGPDQDRVFVLLAAGGDGGGRRMDVGIRVEEEGGRRKEEEVEVEVVVGRRRCGGL